MEINTTWNKFQEGNKNDAAQKTPNETCFRNNKKGKNQLPEQGNLSRKKEQKVHGAKDRQKRRPFGKAFSDAETGIKGTSV